MSDIIFEKIYVETCVDSDKDGKLDLIAVYVRRPKNQMNVPAIFVANPYMMSCNEDWYDVYDVDKPIEIIENQNISEQDIRFDFSAKNDLGDITPRVTRGYADVSPCNEDFELECISELYSHLEKRGYASVFSAGLGTLGSQGVVNTGSYDEVLAFKSVIDWLCGRTRAFTNQIDNIEVRADWCSKKVAMSAKSYLGTLAIGVATTGVEGLETIIPEAGISNWYEYYRYNGLTLPAYEWQGDDLDLLAKYCSSRAKDEQDFASIKQIFDKNDAFLAKNIDRVSGNYNKFWDERNYLNNAEKIKASVFIIHGINDWNVKTSHCYNLFKELEKYDIDRKLCYIKA
ncbi:MAG: CocE/NonD family hydrolase, partial [Clostridia bacterium]